MGRSSFVAGIGAVSAAVFTLLALGLSNPPGGTYSLKDVTNYVAHSHRPAMFAALYLALLSVVGLMFMLSGMRGLAGDTPRQRRAMEISWLAGIAALATLAVGWSIEFVIPLSRALGGGQPIPAPVAYAFTQTGTILIWGAGFFLLGCSLIGFGVGVTAAAPTWWRWVASIAGIGGILSTGFFPSFILALGLLILGIGLAMKKSAPEAAHQAV